MQNASMKSDSGHPAPMEVKSNEWSVCDGGDKETEDSREGNLSEKCHTASCPLHNAFQSSLLRDDDHYSRRTIVRAAAAAAACSASAESNNNRGRGRGEEEVRG